MREQLELHEEVIQIRQVVEQTSDVIRGLCEIDQDSDFYRTILREGVPIAA